MRRAPVLALVGLLALGILAAPAMAADTPIVPDAIWAEGELYGTVLLGSLPYRGNDKSFDRLYMVPGQRAVAEAAPGDPQYNGGRWLPVPVIWNVTPYQLTSEDQVLGAAAAGDVTLGAPMTGAAFLCPLIP